MRSSCFPFVFFQEISWEHRAPGVPPEIGSRIPMRTSDACIAAEFTPDGIGEILPTYRSLKLTVSLTIILSTICIIILRPISTLVDVLVRTGANGAWLGTMAR
jgi:hypothetical protein